MPTPDLIDRLAAGWRAYAVIALLALTAALPGVFSIPPLDRDESRFAQATAQMLETGDFVRIAVQEDPRTKKPVAIHWLQAASVAAFSQVEDRAIWAYRLPSTLGFMVAAAAAFWGGIVLVGRRAAFVGAALFACCVLGSSEAMIAKTDSALCAATTLALAALARLRARAATQAKGGPARGLALLFWGALGAGVLIKGPVTPMVVGLTAAALWGWERRAAWLAPLRWPAGPALAGAIVLPWAVAISLASDGGFFLAAYQDDLGPKLGGGDEGHGGPPGVHTLLVWLLLFPASVALPAAARLVWAGVRAPAGDPAQAGVRFLLAWAVPVWLAFEALPTKLVHYPLPAYPALALLCGAGLLAAFERPWPWTRAAGGLAMALIGAALAGAAGAISMLLPGDADADLRRAAQTALAGAAILVPLVLAYALARRLPLALASLLSGALLFGYEARQRLLPEARDVLVSAEASAALTRAGLHPRLSPGAGRLFALGYREPSFVFLTRTDTALLSAEHAARAAAPGQAVIVEQRQEAAFRAGLAARGLAFLPLGEAVGGLNYSKNDPVRLQPGRVRLASTIPAGASAGPPGP